MSATEKESIVICGAARTPIGSLLGSLSSLKSHDLGAIVIKEALNRAKVEPNEVSQVIMGQVFQAGEGQNPARHAAIKAGLGIHTTAFNVNMVCGSGLMGVIIGVQSIRDGDSNIVVCGGMESMSQTPHSVYMRKPVKFGKVDLQDIILADGLTDAMHQISMGDTAENMAVKFNISREQQDAIALESQRRASNAQSKGLFDEEIVGVPVKTGIVDKDEYIKPGTTLEGLKKLKTVFKTDGTVTAGNASGLNDGAAAVVIMKEKLALQRGIKPLGRIVSYASAGCDPKIMGYGPVPAIKLALERANWTVDEVDIFEINEAFAVISETLNQELKLKPEKVNVNGGAIALGHPLGCSGTRILVTLLYLLKNQNKKKGVASLCIGGGMGVAMCVERIEA